MSDRRDKENGPKSHLKAPGSGLKPPTDFRSPMGGKARTKVKAATSTNSTNSTTATTATTRRRRVLQSKDSAPPTPTRARGGKRVSPTGDNNKRPAKTQRSGRATSAGSATAGATASGSARGSRGKPGSAHRRTRSRGAAQGSASRSVVLSPAPAAHATPSSRSKRGADSRPPSGANPPLIVAANDQGAAMEGQAVATTGRLSGGSVMPEHMSVVAAAREAFDTETDFKAAMSIRLPNAKRMSDREKLAKLRPQITTLKAAMAELLAARDAFVSKCPALDMVIGMTTSSATVETERLRAENEKLDMRVMDLQQKTATLESTCDMLRQRKDELRSEIPQLTEEKRRLSADLESCRADLEAATADARQQTSEVERLTRELASAAERNASLEASLEECKANATKTVERMSHEHAQAMVELKGDHGGRVKEMQDRCTQLTARVTELEASRDTASERASSAQHELAAMTHLRDGLKRENETLQATVTRLQSDLDNTKQNLEEARTRMDKTVQALVEATSVHDSRQDQLSKERQALQDRISALQSEQERLMKQESELKSDLKDARHQCDNLQARVAELSTQLEASQAQFKSATAEVEAAGKEIESLKASLEVMTGKAAEAEAGLTKAQARLVELSHKEEVWGKEKELLEHQNQDLRERNKSALDSVASLSEELSTVKQSAGASNKAQFTKLCEVSKEAAQLRVQMTNMEELRESLERERSKNAQLASKLFDNEMVRRKLHNTIQELRGNIRVFVRVRPFLESDNVADEAEHGSDAEEDEEVDESGAPKEVVRCSADETHVSIVPRASARKAKSSYGFTFDHVFGQSTTQADVFSEVSDLVQSALDGYNVCLFSYGQTGSGKTHTMQGLPGDDTEGLIPRSIKKILEVTKGAAREGWQYTLEASFLEIYNESLNDLLRDESSNHTATLSAHLDSDGTVDVHNLTRVKVSDGSTINELMEKAARMRSVGKTSMNARSSRSHSVFTLRIKGKNAARKVVVTGTLNLVDLAGSERLSRSQAEGARLRETQSINKSLSCLSDVFMALSTNASHIPFRNSKLTFLLQNCFRGDGKTLMMVNLSPHPSSTNESLCSLRFANTVSQVHMGKAKRKVAALGDADSSTASGAGTGAGAGGSTSRPRTSGASRPAKRLSGHKRPASSSRLMAGTAASSSKRRTTSERNVKRTARGRPGWN